MPIVATVTFKPTPSIGKPQRTVDLRTKEETKISIEGRHDPCIVPRAVPVVEAMMAVVLLDYVLGAGVIPRVLGDD
jgi:chorismate synthase